MPPAFQATPSLPSARRRARPPPHLAPILSASPPAANEAPLVCRRSKMILTRRVFSWTLRKRRDAAISAAAARRAAETSPRARESGSAAVASAAAASVRAAVRKTPVPLEAALSADEPVGTYVFHRGIVSFHTKRRAGDPPCRYLELSYGLVEPFSRGVSACSNPRAWGGVKGWYQTAKRWGVLHGDFRETLMLGQERRRYIHACHGEADEGRMERKRRSSIDVSGRGGASESQGTGKSGKVAARLQPSEAAFGPLLVEGKWGRALGRSPRVIVIGDVHGCISELQQLLRLADYQPGDQVVLLGDLVAKGPDSLSVVQLAREIGARTVRGNHDFEVVRWWEAHVRGDRRAMVSMEHARIARSLGVAEHAWLMESPWFIECAEMGHLFVHAGFIPGVKLTQQNPRLMMNMRSVLQDGTVTAKNVTDCEWAKLWQGPERVVFGHDAFRGLQQYEYATGIDTGCVYGGRLTALLLPENRMISVAAKRAYISPKKFRPQVNS